MIKKWIQCFLIALATATQSFAAIVEISSLQELAEYAAQSGNEVRMKPGTYVVKKIYSPDPKTIFQFSGSNNRFDLTGVRLEIDTQVQADMPRGNAHEHTGFLFDGDHIKLIGGEFEDIGENAPPRGINEFTILGNDITFKHCKMTIRGSAPYGYGDMYGKGSGAFTKLQKHAALSILGDRTLIEDCDFNVFAFGHGIHIHGAQDTVIRNVTMEGALRLTDEIYAEKTGLAAKYDYQIMYPSWKSGQPIPKGKMLSLTEDGIRAYLDGADRDGHKRRTGNITVENCTVKRMRGGITITMAKSGTVTDCVVQECGWHAYSIPANGIVRRCKGDAAFGMLLFQPYSNRGNTDIELELLASDQTMGDHSLAEIVGSGHRIKITTADKNASQTLRPIVIGSTGTRHTKENSDIETLRKKNTASEITLINETAHPVHFTEFSSNNRAVTSGTVKDAGTKNQVTR